MARRRKIKHYSRGLYRSRNRFPLIVVPLLAALVIFAVGVFFGPFLLDAGVSFWYNVIKPATSPSSSISAPTSSPDSSSPAPSDSPSLPDSSEDSQSESASSSDTAIGALASGKWFYLEEGSITDANIEALAADLAARDIQYAVITIKATGGTVYSATSVDLAAAASRNSFTLSTVSSALTAVGVTPVARISAFHDNIAAYANRDAALHYLNAGILWLDAAPDAGGQPWLNPYSGYAVDYVSALLQEVNQAGFHTMILADLLFPESDIAELYYGEGVTAGRGDCLANLVAHWQEIYGSYLWVEYPAAFCLYDAPQLGYRSPAKLGVSQLILSGAADAGALQNAVNRSHADGCPVVVGLEGSLGSLQN